MSESKRVYVGGPNVAEQGVDYVLTYDAGKPALRIPLQEARLCGFYKGAGDSLVLVDSYLFSKILAEQPNHAHSYIISNGETLATSLNGLRWEITPAGQARLAWEASLLEERWAIQ